MIDLRVGARPALRPERHARRWLARTLAGI
jgi:hypothetical protein